MNRIHSFVDDAVEEESWSSALAVGLLPDDAVEQDAHCIVTPLHYERNYAYPLVVWLHGAGDDERQVTNVMPLVSSRNYAAVGPRGTLPLDNPLGAYRWSQTPRH